MLLSIVAMVLATSGGCGDRRPHDYYQAPPVPDVAAPTTTEPVGTTRDDEVSPALIESPDAATPTPDEPDSGPTSVAASDGPPESAAKLLPTFAGLFRRLAPSVVNIYTQEIVRSRLIDPWTGRVQPDRVGTSLGSGLVLDVEGHIITNAHVVENAAEVRVRFEDGSENQAHLIGIDLVRDLALLKIDADASLEPAVPGNSDGLAVGDWVIAIGNPFGLSHTLTKGIVSAKGRAEFLSADQGYINLIQTDAPINRGSSGGPLFNLDGEVIGINAVVSAEGQGIGFAIPWRTVEDALPRLKQGGRVSRSWLGVFVRPLPRGAADGVLVEAVLDNSPAMRATLRPGDRIVSLDGLPIRSPSEFRLQVGASVAGRDLRVDVIRGSKPVTLSVRLEEARDP